MLYQLYQGSMGSSALPALPREHGEQCSTSSTRGAGRALMIS